MYLIQILLPLYDNRSRRFGSLLYRQVKMTLSERFHGLTAYSRAAAEGLWRVGKSVKRDDIVVYEVMTETFNARWWKQYRQALEKTFHQESIVVRVQRIALV